MAALTWSYIDSHNIKYNIKLDDTQYLLVILVLSSVQGRERRDAIRENSCRMICYDNDGQTLTLDTTERCIWSTYLHAITLSPPNNRSRLEFKECNFEQTLSPAHAHRVKGGVNYPNLER